MRCVRGLVVAGAILGVTLLSPVATGQTFARQEAHRKAIEKAYADWVDAANDKDLNRFASFLAPDALFLPPNHPALRGERAIRNFYSLLFADSRFSLRCRQERVEVAKSEELAWSTGTCELTFTGPDGDADQDSSKWVKVWKRLSNGEWKCAVSSWSSTLTERPR
jgi:uncharacterized protein (TIGR02246 family)